MVGHAATELLVGAQTKTERPSDSSEMRGDADNAIEAASELPAGAGCQEKQNLPAKGKVFLFDIPFYRTRPGRGKISWTTCRIPMGSFYYVVKTGQPARQKVFPA
jgi:hypothetical protein